MNKNDLLKEKEMLVDLYMKNSKHSQYQILPREFDSIISQNEIKCVSRYENERWSYICKHIDFSEKRVVDIGGNSGFFSFEAIRSGAKRVDYYEGNKDHAEFVLRAAQMFGNDDKLIVHPEYFNFQNYKEKNDVVLLLNVLHHLGDDYGQNNIIMEEAKEKMLQELNYLSISSKILVLQLGFNWKGDRKKSLFSNGTKEEMIEFVQKGIQRYWKIISIGIAQKSDDKIGYCEKNMSNIERDDSLGEFLNRPIFILKSECFAL